MAVLGMVEFNRIATGIHATDAMVKAAEVELIESRPITPGKYISLVTGDVASVSASVKAGIETAGLDGVIESFVLPNLHPQILPVMQGYNPVPDKEAVGILETTGVAAIITATDAALKESPVILVRLHLGLHIGGKGYAVLVGEIADIESSIMAGTRQAGNQLIDKKIIPNPYEEIYQYLMKKPHW